MITLITRDPKLMEVMSRVEERLSRMAPGGSTPGARALVEELVAIAGHSTLDRVKDLQWEARMNSFGPSAGERTRMELDDLLVESRRVR